MRDSTRVGRHDPVDAQHLAERLGDGHARVERGVRVLEDDLDPARDPPGSWPVDALAAVADLACGRFLEADDRPGQRGLPAARFPDQAERLAPHDREVYAIDRAEDRRRTPGEPGSPERVVHVDASELEERVAGDPCWWADRHGLRGRGRHGTPAVAAASTVPAVDHRVPDDDIGWQPVEVDARRCPCGADLAERERSRSADLVRVRAAGVEGATRRHGREVRGRSWDRPRRPRPAQLEVRDAAQEAVRVRVPRTRVDVHDRRRSRRSRPRT